MGSVVTLTSIILSIPVKNMTIHRLLPLYLADIPGFDMGDKPQGAFYLFPNIKRAAQLSHYGTVDDFISALLTETGVAIVPGRAFGMPDHARISYCKDLASLKEAARRIREFVGK